MPTKKRRSRELAPPPSLLFRPVQADFRGLFVSLTQALGHGMLAQWPAAAGKAAEGLLKSFTLKPLPAEEAAYLLVQRAVTRAVLKTISLLGHRADRPVREAPDVVSRRLDDDLKSKTIDLDPNFFQYPARLPVLRSVAVNLGEWLQKTGFGEQEISEEVGKLPLLFVESIEEELRENEAVYQKLKTFETLFTPTVEREIAWARYNIRLHLQADPPVFDLPFRLSDVYIELRASYEKRKGKSPPGGGAAPPGDPARFEQGERVVNHLHEMLLQWLEEADPLSAIRVISGGPGSGKSVFAKRFAAEQASRGQLNGWRVLFIPLHRFSLTTDLRSAVEGFARDEIESSDDLFDPKSPERLLFVFDGLDELSKQGKVGQELAADFFRQVEDLAKDRNRDRTPARLMVLISGRPVAVAITKAEERREGQVYHVLPYHLPAHQVSEYTDPLGLLKVDQRDDWWRKFSVATGEPLDGMPPELRRDELQPITTEPLLNCLVALSRRAGMTFEATTNRNDIYEKLLFDIYHRRHDPRSRPTVDLSFDDYRRLLEEVALTAWHGGDSRVTTRKAVLEQCKKTNLQRILQSVFPEESKPDVTALFLTFYFRQSRERRDEEVTYEFTHKSFSEYLLARRIVEALRYLRRMEEVDPDWNNLRALAKWAEVCGPARFDPDIFKFLCDECSRCELGDVDAWQTLMAGLIGVTLRHGLPMEKLGIATYSEMNRQSRNAEEALLVVHSSCVKRTDRVSKVDWPDMTSASNWIKQLDGARDAGEGQAKNHLEGLDFSGCYFIQIDLSYSNMERCKFSGSLIHVVNLTRSNLSNCQFEGVLFYAITGEGADFSRASFVGCSFNVHFREFLNSKKLFILGKSNLRYSYFQNSLINDCYLKSLDLEGAYMENSNLSRSDLTDAVISAEQLAETRGVPSKLPNGKAPPKNYGKKGRSNPRQKRNRSGSDEPRR